MGCNCSKPAVDDSNVPARQLMFMSGPYMSGALPCPKDGSSDFGGVVSSANTTARNSADRTRQQQQARQRPRSEPAANTNYEPYQGGPPPRLLELELDGASKQRVLVDSVGRTPRPTTREIQKRRAGHVRAQTHT